MGRKRRSSGGAAGVFSRLSPAMQGIVLVLLLLAVGVGLFWQHRHELPGIGTPEETTVETPAGEVDPNLLLGNPSDARPEASLRNNLLMVKPYFCLAYDDSLGTARWVSWRIRAADLGDAPRKRTFDPDAELPLGFTRVTSQDYSGSGFDRGHLCPHGDRDANAEMSGSTFVMTNIIPQAPNVNQKAWAELEMYCRNLVRQQNQRLYVIAGPLGEGGVGSGGKKTTIGRGKVTVPAECWKIIVCVPASGGDNDLAKITAQTRVIAVIMPNDNNAVGDDWSGFRTTVRQVEARTGLRFFDRLSPAVAEALRDKTDSARVSLTTGETYAER